MDSKLVARRASMERLAASPPPSRQRAAVPAGPPIVCRCVYSNTGVDSGGGGDGVYIHIYLRATMRRERFR